MTQLHDLRLRFWFSRKASALLTPSLPNSISPSSRPVAFAGWQLAEAHEDQASDAERRGDTEQAMGWFADSMRLRDVIQVVTSIEIPLPAVTDSEDDDRPGEGGNGDGGISPEPPLAA